MPKALLKGWINLTKKLITVPGDGKKPIFNSNCKISLNILKNKGNIPNSKYLNKDQKETFDVKIGSGCTVFDQYIEYWITQMSPPETNHLELTTPTMQLKFEIILHVWEPGNYIFELTDEVRIKQANSYKTKGIELFKENQIPEAFLKFSQALKLIVLIDNDDVKDLKISIYNNLSYCQILYKNANFCIELCTKSLNIKQNVKALYRRALGYKQLQLYQKAEEDLLNLLKIEKNNTAGINELKEIRILIKTSEENFRNTVGKMFS